MATIKFYLDKARKNGYAPIDLTIHCSGKKIKVSTSEQVKVEDFDVEKQKVKDNAANSVQVNAYLKYLKQRAKYHLSKSDKKNYTNKELKDLLSEYVASYKADNGISFAKEQLKIFGKFYNFIDLFAGAGGFSEGFLQAGENNKFFNFLLGSDINENCDLTRSEEHTSELQSHWYISYAVFCLKKKNIFFYFFHLFALH